MAYTPGIDHVLHTGDRFRLPWLLPMMWPPIALGAEELRKAVVRRSSA
ncbi:MAG TPA: hypothetical protein VF066_05185 [Thermoleophilaceae bacterium]